MKKDVPTSDLGLNFINSLCPVSWTWKDQSQRTGCTPAAFSFTPITGATRSSLVTSNTITPSGCGSTSLVLAHGDGSPQVSINGGAWVYSATINPGDTVAVRSTAKPGYGQIGTVRVEIGGTVAEWTIGTESAPGGATQIFMTSNAYNGNLGGLAGADGICQTEATTLGYGGTWKAILSSTTVNAKDRLTITYPVIRRVDGVVVAPANLWSGGLSNEVNSGAYTIWTGSNSAGVKEGNTWCDDWTNGATYGYERYGYSYIVTGAWISNYSMDCGNNNRLYCVSQ